MNIIKEYLKSSQYVGTRKLPIKQIVLHHTQGSSAEGALSWWRLTPEPVGTNYIIDKDGTIIETFPIDKWAWMIGISSNSNDVNKIFKTQKYSSNIEQMAVGIEIVSQGELIKIDNKQLGHNYYFEAGNRYINPTDVCVLDKEHRGYRYYAKYTDAQLASLSFLAVKLCSDFKIKVNDKFDIFDINLKALQGVEGIYSHVCYRSQDKTDVFPQPELITMLNKLKHVV